MSRALWFVAGGACGVYTLVKARRTLHAFTPDGIGARVAALGAGARVFADEVASGMAEREAELRAQLHLQGSGLLLLEKRSEAATGGFDTGSGSPAVVEGAPSGHR